MIRAPGCKGVVVCLAVEEQALFNMRHDNEREGEQVMSVIQVRRVRVMLCLCLQAVGKIGPTGGKLRPDPTRRIEMDHLGAEKRRFFPFL